MARDSPATSATAAAESIISKVASTKKSGDLARATQWMIEFVGLLFNWQGWDPIWDHLFQGVLDGAGQAVDRDRRICDGRRFDAQRLELFAEDFACRRISVH